MKFDHPAQQIVMQEYVDAVIACGKRFAGLEQQIEHTAQASRVWSVIEALMALRGVNLLTAVTAVTVVAEIGDLKRFAKASQLMTALGLVPSEYSIGGSTRRGGITKTGKSHVRTVLVEAAWTYRQRARKTAVVQRREERTQARSRASPGPRKSDFASATGPWKAKASSRFKVQVCTTIARELAG